MATEEYTAFVSPQWEKQISVDPISLRELSRPEASFELTVTLPPIVAARELPPSLPPVKTQLISCSLPSPASSSPRFDFRFTLLKKKWKNDSQASPRQIENLAHCRSAAISQLSCKQEVHLQRSKSCAEGRSCSPADDLDFWLNQPHAINYDRNHQSSYARTHATKEDYSKTIKKMDHNDEEFKCGAICLYIPAFAKAKPLRPKKEEAESEPANIISRTVSLEKFECGSWASSAIINDHEDGDSMKLYFDLPPELIRHSVNEATSPVAAAFLFDKDRKGVLKNNSTTTKAMHRKSPGSSRHVRFSISSPTSYPASPASCITPRLRKARENFNAFLEAQSA